MPIPPLTPRPSHEDDSPLDRRRQPGAAGDPAGASSADSAFAAAFPDAPLSPSVLALDGRGPVTVLNEVRTRASDITESIDQIQEVGAGLTRVQQLVARLYDVAVVALDRGLHPADRAALQRQVDLVLAEIDEAAEETTFDEGLLHRDVGVLSGRRTPFRAIGTVALGLGGLEVRSSDRALAATGALDVATARLDRQAGALNAASTRLQDELVTLIGPRAPGVDGPDGSETRRDIPGGASAAGREAGALRAALAAEPFLAIQAQADLDAARVRGLLESAPG